MLGESASPASLGQDAGDGYPTQVSGACTDHRFVPVSRVGLVRLNARHVTDCVS